MTPITFPPPDQRLAGRLSSSDGTPVRQLGKDPSLRTWECSRASKVEARTGDIALDDVVMPGSRGQDVRNEIRSELETEMEKAEFRGLGYLFLRCLCFHIRYDDGEGREAVI